MYQKRVNVIGDVIGVGFRAWTRFIARKLHVTGWVRNVYDHPEIYGAKGGVEALLQSPDATTLKKMIKKLYAGPPLARVEKVIEHEVNDVSEYFDSFTVLKESN